MTCGPNKKQALLLVLITMLSLIGGAVLLLDVIEHGSLHAMNALVGAGALVLATALALPLRFREALDSIIPALKVWRGGGHE